MGNLLTHGLLAAALMTAVNLILGLDAISWNVFLAAAIAIALNLDAGDSRISPGSPACHSLGCGIAMVYIAGVAAFLAWAFLGIPQAIVKEFLIAAAVGVLGHLIAEMATGEQVFTFPGNLKPETWSVCCDCESEKFWPAWGRLPIIRRRVKDAHINGISLAMILASIGFGGAF